MSGHIAPPQQRVRENRGVRVGVVAAIGPPRSRVNIEQKASGGMFPLHNTASGTTGFLGKWNELCRARAGVAVGR